MRSLRARLTLGTTLVLGAVLLAFGVSASRAVERSERAALDDRLRRTAELSLATAQAAIEQELPEGDRRLDAVLRATSTSVRLLLGPTVLYDTGRPPPSQPAPREGFSTFEAADRRWRTYVTTLEDEALGGLALLQVTTPVTPLDRRLASLDRRFAVIGLLALLLAATAVWLATTLLLQPLRRLQALTADIEGDRDLDRRVPLAGPDEVRSLAASFNAMLARLGRSSAATRRFAADAGHELRTPLTSVQATLSALRRHPDVPVQQRNELLDDALAAHRRMVLLLDGLQALARGDAAPPPDEDADLAEVAAGAADDWRARHPGRRLDTVLPDGPVPLRGWPPGLRLVVDNLLENAARHGGEHVRLEVRDGPPAVVVEDDGPGIPEGERERVLEPFARAAATDVPGSGLGLALVAQQARHHGGAVTVDGSPLGGARIAVTLGGGPRD